jgi:molecular chaperone GrpE
MTTVGEPFDPEKHEALLQIDSDEIPEGHVAQEVAPGYLLGEKVIRHAKVVVSRGRRDESEQAQVTEDL